MDHKVRLNCKIKGKRDLFRLNVKVARRIWRDTDWSLSARNHLKELTEKYHLSIATGDLRLLEGRWYVTHAGLLRISERRRCAGIRTTLDKVSSNSSSGRWVFKATIYKTPGSKGFVGYGDADPSNVSPLVRGAEMRVAETRAVNRALRKAYGIGLCSVEELGWAPRLSGSDQPNPIPAKSNDNGYHGGGQPRLRDQLCLLIRNYNLDPSLVKTYAAHFCGTETIKDASRDLVESFISHLAASAKEDLDGLICKLNSYARPVEVKP